MTDIAERLRNAAALSLNEYGEADRYLEAADEIERLRERGDVYKGIARDYKAEIERLRRRLCEIHDLAKCGPVSRPEYMSRMRDIENVSRMGEKS